MQKVRMLVNQGEEGKRGPTIIVNVPRVPVSGDVIFIDSYKVLVLEVRMEDRNETTTCVVKEILTPVANHQD